MYRIQKFIVFYPFTIGFITLMTSLIITIAPVFISYEQQKQNYFQSFRTHVGILASTLATIVDGDLHKTLRDNSQLNNKDYKKAILPLVKFHNVNPNIFYVYTLIEKENSIYYILDTMSDDRLNLGRPALENTEIMEELEILEENQDNWIETDNYGTFVSGHAPFYDSSGHLEGFVGIDYDTTVYNASIKEYTNVFYNTVVISILLSVVYALVITYLAIQIKNYYLKVEELSKYDSLTGLYNKRTFEILLEKALQKADRDRKYLFFMILDIDDFKEINDSHGHQIGDEAIKKVTEKLKNLLRDSDTFARFGGDEFLIYLTDYNDEAAGKLIDRIEKSFANSAVEVDNETVLKITLSIGYTKSKENCNYKILLERADKALYISKETGKGIGTFLA